MAVALDRGEGTGLGLALLGHLVLFGLLTVGFLATPNPAKLEPTPIEISLTDEAGLKSEAPVINRSAGASRLITGAQGHATADPARGPSHRPPHRHRQRPHRSAEQG